MSVMPAKEKNAVENSDSALMMLFADGEVQGFERLYEKHKESIFKFFFYGTNGDTELSAELFQDVWMTIVRGRKRFTKNISFVDWLRHVAWARLYDHLRIFPVACFPEAEYSETERSDSTQHSAGQHSKEQHSKEQHVPEKHGTGQFEIEREAHSNIVSLVKREVLPSHLSCHRNENGLLSTMQSLPDEQCEIVLLRYCFNMDLNEIASFLDLARTSVSQLHRQALISLRRTLPEAV